MATKLIIITDAWHPQVNGVVTTYKNYIENLPAEYSVELIEPSQFKNFTLPFYKEIKFSFCTFNTMKDRIFEYRKNNPKTIFHIATEGPLGVQAKLVLDKYKLQYTSAYHTNFPQFIDHLLHIPPKYTSWYFRWFHRKSKFVMFSSKSSLEDLGYNNGIVMEKGYDSHFSFTSKQESSIIKLLYVGRVSREKSIEDFCNINIEPYYENKTVQKIVVGGGPDLKRLKKLYPNISFVGYKFGEELAEYYKNADVFVFPSKTDTYGIVVLESMACGTPVAAYPVTGPIDQIIDGVNGYTDQDLTFATIRCIHQLSGSNRQGVYDTVKNIQWKNSANLFIKYVDFNRGLI